MAIPENVRQFISKASDDAGRIEATWFDVEICRFIDEHSIASPIEQIFVAAIHVMAKANFERINPPPLMGAGGEYNGHGVYVQPQFCVDKFRVDFRVERFGNYGHSTGVVLVELDGHEFHDKDKKQRSYEKARDRFLAKSGFVVLHFTGSDVVADPYKVAHEVLDAVQSYGGVGAFAYDPQNPFGID